MPKMMHPDDDPLRCVRGARTRRFTMNDKRTYETPKLVDLGAVTDVTQTGRTNPGGDAKQGSVGHSRGI